MAETARARLVPRLRWSPDRRSEAGYRPALDGVRAVAVLAVIAYHVGWRVPGGFLGVDVFFVLSGYLITGLLLREKTESGRIRLGEFWLRRARRLLPAVVLLLIVCAVITRESAPIGTLLARRADMLSTLFYFANWHFIDTSQTYFASYTGVSPHRHTWSLAIEEQFYLLWPLVLFALMQLIRGWRRVLPWLIIAAAGASTVLMAMRYTAANPIRSYYGTDTRMHALLIGAALAAIARLHPDAMNGARARRIAGLISPVVVVSVLVAFFAIGDQDSIYYRGGSLVFAVVVALGLWVLETRQTSFLAAALSVAPARWVGRISYGLYLWHWPLIVWVGESERFSTWSPLQRQALEVGLTFAIATVSFYLVECPVRYGTLPWVRAHARRFIAVAAACIAIPAFMAVQATQFRISIARGVHHVNAAAIARQLTDKSIVECAPSPDLEDRYGWCEKAGSLSVEAPVVAVAGDSTSLALYPGMWNEARTRGWRYVQAGSDGCSVTPLLFVGSTDPAEVATKASCPKLIPSLLAHVIDAYHPDVWIINDWIASAQLVLADGRVLAPSDPRRVRIIASALRTMLEQLTADGAQVIYLKALPAAEPVDCITDRPPSTCDDRSHSVEFPNVEVLDRAVRRATADLPGVAYLSIDDILCPDDGRCPAVVGGQLARYDAVHYTSGFSTKIVPMIISRAERAGVSFTHTAR
jgi:peptidoglycan/LPS O-acetylase OafA/YrhL